MKWVITAHVHYDRVASPWLIERFIDPAAEFSYVTLARGQTVKDLTPEQLPPGAIPLAIPGAKLGPHDEQGPLFVKVLREYKLDGDPALKLMGEVVTKGVEYVVHDWRPAVDDRYGHIAVGLLAFHDGLTVTEPDDRKRLDKGYVLWDSIYGLFKANKQRG